jgi:hypothetical protein
METTHSGPDARVDDARREASAARALAEEYRRQASAAPDSAGNVVLHGQAAGESLRAANLELDAALTQLPLSRSGRFDRHRAPRADDSDDAAA